MKKVKILAVLSALDLKFRYGCTPAWWQLLKGLYENGAEVIATTYQGGAVESPWWRTYPNPCYNEARIFTRLKRLGQSVVSGRKEADEESAGDIVIRRLAQNWVKPRWERHLKHILRQEGDIQALIVFTVPLNHFSGLPSIIRSHAGIPVFYYDGDVPASLPRFSGYASGFRIYQGADPGEYDGFVCNSLGGAEELKGMGAREVKVLYWGVDAEFYAPFPAEAEHDVAFYGFGAKYRREWVDKMVLQPAAAMPEHRFVLGGRGFAAERENIRLREDVPLNAFRFFCRGARLNLNITRRAHASLYASSSCRPFELAAMECCVVSNPCAGLEEWFEPGREVLIVRSAEEAIEVYRRLLRDEEACLRIGAAARKRVLAEHTSRRRAAELIRFVTGGRGTAVP